MQKAGIQIVDLKDVEITLETPVTIAGVYASVVNSNRKPTLVTGINLGGSLLPSVYASFYESSGDYVASFLVTPTTVFVITVTDEDSVTVEAVTLAVDE